MNHMPCITKAALLLLISATSASVAHADVVYANQDIYAAGQTTPTLALSQGGGLNPTLVPIVGASALQFIVTGGPITLNDHGNYNNADGVGAAVATSSNTGYGSISGITAPNAGYLVGLFVAPGGPSGSAPASLNFVTSGTGFSTLSPLLDQVFFIGDGLTGNGTGSLQTFIVPTGATQLYLGISDANGYNGAPGFYFDNTGNFLVTTNFVAVPTSPIPEPSSLLLLATGGLGLLATVGRKRLGLLSIRG